MSSSNIQFITNQRDFESCLGSLSSSNVLAMDTEFVRTNTFYPNLGLLQLGDGDGCFLIDPLEVTDWSPFKSMLSDASKHFIVHSAGEDLNLLWAEFGVLPANLIDTQIACGLTGLGFSLSYQALVAELLDIELEKSETRSDWLRRPLTDSQLDYAALDVLHLHEIWDHLRTKLEQLKRLDWLAEESTALKLITMAAEDSSNWETLCCDLSNAWKLSEPALKNLQLVCYWRELEARERNKPRNWIGSDRDLVIVAKDCCRPGKTIAQQIHDNPDLDKRFKSRYGSKLSTLLEYPEWQLVELDARDLNRPLPPVMRNALKACQKIIRARAEQLDLAPELLGRKRQIVQLLQDVQKEGLQAWPGVFSGWREQILAADLKPVLERAL